MTESPQPTPDPDPATTPSAPVPVLPPSPTDPGPTIDASWGRGLDEVIEAGHVRDAWANTIAFLVMRGEAVPPLFADAYARADYYYRHLVEVQLVKALA